MQSHRALSVTLTPAVITVAIGLVKAWLGSQVDSEAEPMHRPKESDFRRRLFTRVAANHAKHSMETSLHERVAVGSAEKE
jgi:hypothetical protein